jgi:membrane protein implicated in regulation of membrane protease activity
VSTVFLICAVIGGTVLLFQFVMMLVGLGGHGLHLDVPHDVSVDMPHDFGLDVGHVDPGSIDAGPGDIGPVDIGHVDIGHVDIGHGDIPEDAGEAHLDSNWLFGVLSFRTIIAALTFFGLFGLAAEAAGLGLLLQLPVALAGGGTAMYGVYWLFRMLNKLEQDGTQRIHRAIGHVGTVYVPIAGGKTEAGKIQIKVQGRLVEYPAITAAADKLYTGSQVRVVGLLSDGVLEVEPLQETAEKVPSQEPQPGDEQLASGRKSASLP